MQGKQVLPQVTLSSQQVLTTTSLNIAEVFGKKHKNILRDIELLKPDLPEDFTGLNFEPSSYRDSTGRENPMYLLTRDAFTLLVMGFTGKKALQFKLAYIAEFNRMEAMLKTKGEEQSSISMSKEPQLIWLDGQFFATSLNIAEVFNKTHRHVMRDIRLLQYKLPTEFFNEHFQESSYQNANDIEYTMYYLSRTGLSLLIMGYTSPRYFTLKCQFLEKFLEKENVPLQGENLTALPAKQRAINHTNTIIRDTMNNNATRYQSFRSEMVLKGLTWNDIGKALGISKQGSLMAIQRETIKEEHYDKLLKMGFSKNVLPSPITK